MTSERRAALWSSSAHGASGTSQPWAAVAVAVLAFFIVTLDAVVVNVALPSIQDSLGGGVQGLQWVVDGYTLMFAALLADGRLVV